MCYNYIGDNMNNLLVLLSIVPSIVIAFIVYSSDKKEKEPVKELIKAFVLGILSIILTLTISFPLGVGNVDPRKCNIIEIIGYSFIAVALIEELSKWICSYLSIKDNPNFNYMYDGIVYFSFVALGFATVENILYALNGTLQTVLIRAITTAPAHVMFGLISGYYYAIYKREKIKHNKGYKTYLFFSIIIPIMLHGFYDFCLLTGNYVFFFIYVIFISSLYTFSINSAMKMEKYDRQVKD